MATRDNQGLQIALILFVMITLLLAVTTFVYYRKSEEKIKDALAARNEASLAQENANILNYKTEALKYMVGAPGALTAAELQSLKASVAPDKIEDVDAIQADFDQAMVMYGEGMPDTEKNYGKLPQHLGEELRKAKVFQVGQADEIKRLELEKQATEKREGDRAKAAVAAQNQAAQDLAAERDKFNQHKSQIDQQNQQYAAQLSGKDDEIRQAVSQSQSQQKTLSDQVARLEATVTIQEEKLKGAEPSDTFETPDGRVTWVNQREHLVWINLGLADGLRRQVTFSVYDQSLNGVVQGESKASLEVTRMIDQHMAEARIIDDELSNPVLPGDYVHTPAWRPGRRIRFALAGVMDVSGNGKSDRDLVRNLIARNGGLIDVELMDDGTLRGELTAETRYLVLGIKPTETSATGYLDSYSKIITEAQQFGIQRISIDEFLSYMGWKGEVRTINLGKGSQSRDFLRPGGGGSSPQSGGPGVFRDRRPPGRSSSGGAY